MDSLRHDGIGMVGGEFATTGDAISSDLRRENTDFIGVATVRRFCDDSVTEGFALLFSLVGNASDLLTFRD